MSTPSVVQTGYPSPILTWPWGGGGTLLGGTLWWGTLPGVPAGGYPKWVPPWQGSPHPDLAGGYPTWVSPGRVPPDVCPNGILGNAAKHYGIWVPPLWTDRWMEGQTRFKTLPSRRTTYAGSNKTALLRERKRHTGRPQCSLCCPIWQGVPQSWPGAGYPIPGWWGTPSRNLGYPCPGLAGIPPILTWRGHPCGQTD